MIDALSAAPTEGMLPKGPCAVAVSGGVDSLCALLLCLKAGLEVTAVHALFHRDASAATADISAMKRVCGTLGVPLEILDLQEAFQKSVVAGFAGEYRLGRTPNPCARCNASMKFGVLMDAVHAMGLDWLVTGHYAALSRSPHPASDEAPMLMRAQDARKDQSYFLSLVPRIRLAHVSFPLAGMEKSACMELVREAGLSVPVPKESQDVCFIPRQADHYRRFLEGLWKNSNLAMPGTGPVVLDGVGRDCPRRIGVHQGLWRYTEGQRQGIGIPYHEPLYVTAKDMESNTLHVGTKPLSRMGGAVVGELNYMVDELPERAWARLRYRQAPAPCSLERLGEDRLLVRLDEALPLSAPGQVACITDELGRVLAGGIMELVQPVSPDRT